MDYIFNPNMELKYPETNTEWFFYILSSNKHLTLDIIERYIHKSWNWNDLSANHHLTAAFVQKYRDIPWAVSKLAENPAFSPDDLATLFDERKIRAFIDINPNVAERPDRPNRYNANPNCTVTMSLVESSTDAEIHELSRNPNLRWKHIEAFPHKNWCVKYILANPMEKYVYPEQSVRYHAQRHCRRMKEELLAAVFHPDRVERFAGYKWLEYVD